MATPTLPPYWTPIQAGCLRPTDYWIWDYDQSIDNRTVLGGPSQTTACFPPTYTTAGVYIGTQCPPQYSSVCQGADALSAVTCCPTSAPSLYSSSTKPSLTASYLSIYAFSCIPPTETIPHASVFHCVSQFGTSGIMTVTLTDFGANTVDVGVRTIFPDLHLFALGLAFVTPSPALVR
jgi:hypothetical protein